MTDLNDLARRCEEGSGGDRELDGEIEVALKGGEIVWKTANYTMEQYPARRHPSKMHVGGFANSPVPHLTDSLDAAVSFVERALPGFWWRGGTCFLSSEAIVCPDHNCPTHGARLTVECPQSLAHWNEGIEVEIRPGSQGALVRALMAAALRALAHKEKNDG